MTHSSLSLKTQRKKECRFWEWPTERTLPRSFSRESVNRYSAALSSASVLPVIPMLLNTTSPRQGSVLNTQSRGQPHWYQDLKWSNAMSPAWQIDRCRAPITRSLWNPPPMENTSSSCSATQPKWIQTALLDNGANHPPLDSILYAHLAHKDSWLAPTAIYTRAETKKPTPPTNLEVKVWV